MKKILIVDDEPNIVMTLEYAFKKKNFQVFIARDGSEALEIIKTEFSEEVNLFTKNFIDNNFSEAANNVHKLKHKIGLLGLESGLKVASAFEEGLKKGNTKLHHNFLDVLDKIHVYLY